MKKNSAVAENKPAAQALRVPAAKIVFPPEDLDALMVEMRSVIQSGQLTLGRHGKAFEEAFAAMTGVRYAVAVNSGTSSLEIILRALGLEGGEVIVPVNTFFATAAAVLHAQCRLRFADVSAKSFCLDLPSLKKALTPQTKAVVVVHIGGAIPPDMEAMLRLCSERGIPLIEDAAHAHGSSLKGVFAGAFGRAGSFSFYPTKVMTAGEGGMITTNDAKIYEEALVYRDQGKAGFTANVHTRLGYNWRMSELHALLGASQLKRLPSFLKDRRAAARIYERELSKTRVVELPPKVEGLESNFYKFPVLLRPGVDRAALKKRLRETKGVALSGEVYELPLHQQPVFSAWAAGQSFPAAEDVCKRQICLPVFAGMTPEDASYAAASLIETLSELEAGGPAR